MKRLTVLLSLLAVFVSGVVVGALGYRLYMAKTVGAVSAQRSGSPSPEEFRKRYVNELRERLHLDEQQVAELNAILDRAKQRHQALREKQKPEVKAIYEQQVDEIRAMLRPEQRPEFERFREEREKKRKEMEKRGY